MKHNSVWGKLLLLTLSFVLAFSTLVSCTKDDIAALDKENDEIKTELGTTEENLKKLETLVNSIKVTADAAATKDALAAANAALEEVKATANAAATAAKLDEVKTALEAALAGKADSAVKAELEAAIALVKATADAAVTEAKLTAAKTELVNAINGKADKNALEAAVAKITSLEEAGATDAELATVKTALEAAIAGKATAADITAAVATVEAKLADYAKAADVAKLQKELGDKIAALETKVDTAVANIDTELTALKAEDARLGGIINILQADVKALKENAGAFADGFQTATKVLNGDLLVKVDENGNITLDEDEGTAYSLKAFDDIWDEFDEIENYYTDEDYNDVKALYEDLKFFLNRAVSAEAVVGFFNQFTDKIENLPSLAQVLAAKVGAYYPTTGEDDTVVPAVKYLAANNKDTDDDITEIKALRAQITSVNADDSVSAELQANYDALVAAYDYLELAEDDAVATKGAIDAVTAIGKVIYIDSDAAITTAKTAVELVASTWFATAEEDQPATEYDTHKKFFAEGEGVATVVANYETYTKALARQTELVNAFNGKITVAIENGYDATKYNTVKPLWTDMAPIDAKVADFVAWCTLYNIKVEDDAKTITNIYGTDIDLLNKADAYATAMDKVYNETKFAGLNNTEIVGVKALNDLVAALCAKDVVLFADYAEFKAYETAYGETLVKAAKDALTTEYTDDGANANFLAMMTQELYDAFMDDLEVVEKLNDANTELDAIYDAMVALVEANLAVDAKKPVTFKDSYAIKAWEAKIVEIYDSVRVNMNAEDANFVEMEKVKSATDKLAELKADYEALVKAIRAMYDEITTALGADDGAKMSLTLGLRLGAYNALLDTIPTDTVDINLNLDDDENKVTLADLTRKLAQANTAYKNYAAQAQTAAADVIVKITAADYVALTTDTLNNYAAIVAVREALNDWLETYILDTKYAVEFDEQGIPTKYVTVNDLKDVAAVKAALEAIANVPVAGTAGAQKYAFVTVENYSYCVDKYDAIVAFRAKADADWAELKAQFGPLTDSATQTPSKDIHNLAKYGNVNFLDYINTYYKGELDGMAGVASLVINPVNDEINVYNAFKASWDACKANDAAAGIKRTDIHNAIAALPAPDATNYATVLSDVEAIRALIENYYASYCPTECSDCITDADLLLLEKRAAVAEVVKYAEEVVRVKANTDTNEKIDGTVVYWTDRINDYTNSDVDAAIAKVIDFIGQAKEQFKLDYPCLVADNPLAPADVHTYGDDCVCDYCDYKKDCVDTVKDHKCDVCTLTDEFPPCEDSDYDDDHVCDYCGIEKNGCVDNDADHNCDVCGKADITTCNDVAEDGDHKCDLCGELIANATCTDTDTDGKCDECGADVATLV